MDSKIRKLKLTDMTAYTDIVANAYPGFEILTEDKKEEVKKRLWKIKRDDPVIDMYGLFRGGRMDGGMRFFDFDMNFRGINMPVGGLGLVAVDLIRKKEKVAKEMIDFYLDHYRKKKYCMTALYPFRPDFYRQMGWGYGKKLSQYVVDPLHLPRGKSKKHIVFLSEKDKPAIASCYNRVAARTHGMFKKCKYEMNRMFEPESRIIGYKTGRRVEGYMKFNFKPADQSTGNFTHNNIHITQLIYEHRDVLAEFLTFLHIQADQIYRIHLPLNNDDFHFIPFDPRNDTKRMLSPVFHEVNTQAMGIMYRIIDLKRFFKLTDKINYGNVNLALGLEIKDTFCPDNRGNLTVIFKNGKPRVTNSVKPGVTIGLDISDFSSMAMGAVDFESLYELNRADISNKKYLNDINAAFKTPGKPITITLF